MTVENALRAYQLGQDSYGWEVRGQKAQTEAGEVFRFTASTADVDRMGDVVRQDWRLANYRRNPVILWNHNAGEPIGRAVSVGTPKESGNLEIDVVFDESDENPRGKQIAHMFRAGFLQAGSVGFRSGKRTLRADLDKDHPAYQELGDTPRWRGGFFFEKNELLEFSAVAIPANPQALAARSFALEAGDLDQALRRWLKETHGKALTDFLLDVFRTDPRFKRELTLTQLLGGDDHAVSGPTQTDLERWFRQQKQNQRA